MKNQRQKCTAIKGLLFAALLLFGGAAWAQVAGTVMHLSGPLIAKKANGAVKVLTVKSEVENGDTLVSEKNTYAQVKFIDNSQITLRPGTTFHVEKFSYDEGKPEGDSAAFSLVKGGLRSVSGALGKRNKEKFALKTPTATIGIRGTTFIAHYVPPPPSNGRRADDPLTDTTQITAGNAGQAVKTPVGPTGGMSREEQALNLINSGTAAQGKAPGTGGLPVVPPGSGNASVGKSPNTGSAPVLAPGLHLNVTDGAIIVTNNGGSLGFQAGQFGYVPNANQPPVVVPSNPNIQFVPPPSFDAGSGGPTASNGPGQGQATDCVVR